MKKKLSIALVLCLGVSMVLLFSGCGAETKTETETKEGAYSAYNLEEYIELPDYDAYAFDAPVPAEVTKEEMEAGIRKDLYDYGVVYQESTGKVLMGDTITISYTGKLTDGTERDDIAAEEYSMKMGEGNAIEGFEEGLLGAEVGEVTTVKAKYPDPYTTDTTLSGKEVVFEVKVHNRKNVVLPDLTDELIEEAHQGYYASLDDYLADVEKYYVELHEKEAKVALKEEIFAKIVNETKVLKYPEDEVSKKGASYIMNHMEYASENQYSWESYLSDYLKMTEKEFEKTATAYAEEMVKYEMVVYAMAEKEGLEITDEEYQAGMDTYLAEVAMMTAEQFENYMEMTIEEYAEENNLECQLLMEEAMDFVYKKTVKSGK